MNWTQIALCYVNCYALSIFRVFILLASSDSDKHMLMRQKVLTKIRLYKIKMRTVRKTFTKITVHKCSSALALWRGRTTKGSRPRCA